MAGRRVWVVLAPLVISACGRLPAPLAPTPSPTYSALELESEVRDGDHRHLDFAPDGVLHTLDDRSLQGPESIRAYLEATFSASMEPLQFFPVQVWRCGPEEGLEVGRYRGLLRASDTDMHLSAGPWYARWRRAPDGAWRIQEARLMRPGQTAMPVTEGCVDADAEFAAKSRFTGSVLGGPFALFTADPNGRRDPRVTSRDYITERARMGLLLSARYRIGSWFSLGGMWGWEPTIRTKTEQGVGDANLFIKSRGDFAAATVGFQGRNVLFEAGPATARTRWEWTNSDRPFAVEGDRVVGAVVGTRLTYTSPSGVGIELAAQRRFFPLEEVPRSGGLRHGSRRGFFFSLGLALRRTRR